MIIDKRFALRVVGKPRKDGIVKGELMIDLLEKPYTLEELRGMGINSKNSFIFREIYKKYSNNLTEGMNYYKLYRRIERLKKGGWLKSDNSFSKKSEDYLKEFSSFINKKGMLMKSKKRGIGYGSD